MAGPIVVEKQYAQLVSRQEVTVDLVCVPRDAQLSDPSTDGCGYRGRGKAWVERVQLRNEGEIVPSGEREYTVFDNADTGEHTELTCPECGHELSVQQGVSARTTRRRNLRKVEDADEADQAA